jgi:hypothetical protein
VTGWGVDDEGIALVKGENGHFRHFEPGKARGIDALTITMGLEADRFLGGLTEHLQPGGAQKGFRATEERMCMGGTYWRKSEPQTASKLAWAGAEGRGYVTCEFKGQPSTWAARTLRGQADVRPSRVDVAWDFNVPDDVRAETIAKLWMPHLEKRRIKSGISGEGDVFTHYAGAAASDIRVRCYRRDLKDPWLEFYLGCCLRLELVLRDQHARRFWAVWAEDEQKAYAVAAHYMHRQTGLVVQEEMEVPPDLVYQDPEEDAAQEVFEFVKQWSSILEHSRQVGIDLPELSKAYSATWNPRMKRLHKARMKARGGIAGEDITRRVLELIEYLRRAEA